MPQPLITGSNAPTSLSAHDPSAAWGLASCHHFDPSSIKAVDDSGRNAQNEVRQSLGSSTNLTAIMRTIRSSWDSLVRSDPTPRLS
ncbi:hypothetical protein CRG98_033292 [Punica granatum]|uniref:Uncharacterized protein n=1 Tax=Punica granatum TaxID=22663 RepID=A0A2I0ISA0_PUNGR|nr:hypothetical protein CRG98_033292 [Punica granatum]